MELLNNGPAPVRILADARLLWFEVITAPEPSSAARKGARAQAFPRGKIPVCRPPAELRPEGEFERRAILLRPGERYSEPFDPMLLCGASKLMAGLKPGAVIYPHYGYPDPPRKPWQKQPDLAALPPAPHVLDSVSEPRAIRPARGLEGGVLVLSRPPEAPAPAPAPAPSAPPAPTEGAPEPPPVVDERGPRLQVSATPLVDAHDRSGITVTVTLKNEGHRPALLHFRTDNLNFLVQTPEGTTVRCNQGDRGRSPVRDFFETLRPGGRRSTTIRLQEFCPFEAFDRPGVYRIQTRLDLHQSGDAYRLPALVSRENAEGVTRLRLRTGPRPYHWAPPRLVGAAPSPPAAGTEPPEEPSTSP
jgi:hypothetical protein